MPPWLHHQMARGHARTHTHPRAHTHAHTHTHTYQAHARTPCAHCMHAPCTRIHAMHMHERAHPHAPHAHIRAHTRAHTNTQTLHTHTRTYFLMSSWKPYRQDNIRGMASSWTSRGFISIVVRPESARESCAWPAQRASPVPACRTSKLFCVTSSIIKCSGTLKSVTGQCNV